VSRLQFNRDQFAYWLGVFPQNVCFPKIRKKKLRLTKSEPVFLAPDGTGWSSKPTIKRPPPEFAIAAMFRLVLPGPRVTGLDYCSLRCLQFGFVDRRGMEATGASQSPVGSSRWDSFVELTG